MLQKNQIDEKIIFDIYKQIPFNLNTLINAKNIYQTLDEIEQDHLFIKNIYYLKDTETKTEYLFFIEELFKKDEIQNIFSKFF